MGADGMHESMHGFVCFCSRLSALVAVKKVLMETGMVFSRLASLNQFVATMCKH